MNARTLLIASVLAVSGAVTGCNCGPTPTGTKLVFTTQPQGTEAGVPFTPAVQVAITDDQGNVVTTAAGQVTIALQANPGGGSLGGTLTQTAVEGVATFSDLNLTKAAAGYTLKATSSGLTDAISNPFSISPGPPAALSFTQAPSDAAAGAVIAPPVTVALLDAFGNQTAAAAGVSIAISTGPAGAVLGGTTTVTSSAGVATFNGLTLDLEGSYTLSASSGSLPVLVSPAFNIRPGTPASLAFTVQPSNATAGTPISPAVQVTLLDARGNVARNATDAVTLSLGNNPGGGTLSGTLTRNAVNGVATFTDLSVDKAGTGYTLRAASGTLSPATSNAFDIAAAAASRLAFTVQPTSAAAGTAIAPAVQVSILDAFGNPTTSTASVTVALGNNPGGATLSGTLTRSAVAGVATFNDLSVDKVGTGYTLAASSAGLTSATSAAFDITSSATPTQLAFRTQPSDAEAGAPISPAVEVLLLDSFGNRTSSTAAVTISIGANPAGGTLSGTLTVNAVAGLATFSNLSIDKAGTGYTLAASSAGLPAATSATFNITPGPAAGLVFRQQPSNAAAGASISPAVQVALVDAFGNQTSSTATVTLSIASGPNGAALGGTTSQAAVAGLATFGNLSITLAGTYTLAASAGALTATSNAFTISAAAAAQLAFTVQPSSTAAATAISPAVQVSIQDAFGNLTSSTANVTVALGSNPGGGTLSGTLTRAAAGGVATFANLSIDKAGAGYTLAASSAGLAGDTSAGFDITAGAAARLAFTVQPSNTVAGAAITPDVAVTIQDAQGNTVVTSSATVSIALGANPSGGTLSGSTSIAANSGVATFSGLNIDKVGAGYTLVASSAGLTSATSVAFNVTAAGADHLVFVTQPRDAPAGGGFASPSLRVAVVDAFGNTVTTSTAIVTLAIGNNPGGGTLSGPTTVPAVAGVATFSSLSIDKAGAGYTLVASSPGLTSATSNPFTITAGPASQLAFVQQPTDASAAAAIAPPVTVAIRDAFGNQTTSSVLVTVAMGNNPGGGTLSGATTVPAVAGVATFSSLSINKAGNGYTLTAASAGLTGATSSAFNITAGAAAAVIFQQQPTNTASGAVITPAVTVAIVDASGNVVTTSTATVTMAIGTNPSGGTLSGTTSVAAVAGVATFSNLSINTAGTGYTLVASSTGLTSATSNAFNIGSGLATRLAFITQPSNAVAGAAIAPAVRVAIQDALGNTVTTSTATVTMAIGNNPGGGTLGGTVSVAAVAGVATFSTLSINKVGTGYTLVASSTGLTSATSTAFNITAAAATQLAFVQQPTNAAAGAAITPAVTVAILDAFGNQTASTANVTLAIGTNPGGGTLSGPTTVAAVAGVATFSNLSIDRAGTGYTLNATSLGLGSATSSAFNITAGLASRLVFAQQPSNTAAGATISPAVMVQVQDAFGNVVTTSTATVTMAIGNNPSGGTLSGTTSVAAVAGVATFSNLSINAVGTGYTLFASSTGLTSATSAAFNITGGLATRVGFITQPSNTVAGAPITPAVRVAIQDALGNTVTTSTATVTIVIGNNPGGGTLGGTVSVAAVAGVATFSNLTINKTGTGYTLVASSPGLTSATSTAFNISPAAADHLVFGTQPTSGPVGSNFGPALQVIVVDAFGNTVTSSSASVTLALGSNPSGGTLSGTTTVAATAGVATFTNLSLTTAGVGYTLVASSPGLISATSNPFDVTPGPANRLAFGQQPSNAAAGAAISPAVTVRVQDAFGNTVTTSTATVTMAIGNNPGGGTLGGTTSVAAVAGIATFSTLTISAAGTGYTLVAASAGLTSATSAAFNITASASLSYTDPAPGGKIRLVRNAASTSTTVVLDLVAAVPLTGFQVGFNLPLDTTRVQANATLQTPGTALPAGAPPIAAKAVIPATGPLANVLVSGQSQKAAGAGAVPANSSVPAGAVFYQLRLDLKAGATAGTVFDGAALGALFAGNMRDRAGTDVAVSTDFVIGRLVVN